MLLRRAMSTSSYTNLLLSRQGSTNLIRLNRPKALNALNAELMRELRDALQQADQDAEIKCSVLTGSKKAFAAGADIEMKDLTYIQAISSNFLADWSAVAQARKPIIGAVQGYALGGGCELAMMCDILLADLSAVFGQPEINLGILPGGGGTQRLTRAIGQSRAMEYILTGQNFTAQQAVEWGLVSRLVEGDGDEVVEEAIKLAEKIGSKSSVAVVAAKNAIKAASDLPLAQGLDYERQLFHASFSTKDQKEGMAAFVEKRKPQWSHS